MARKRTFRVLWVNIHTGRMHRTTERIGRETDSVAVSIRLEVTRRHHLMPDAAQILEVEEAGV